MTSGVPLAKGALPGTKNVVLLTAEGQNVPLQTDVLARWPDGSVRWLLLDFQTDLAARQKKQFALRLGAKASAPPLLSPVQISAQAQGTTLETGPLRLELSRENFDPLGAVWLDRNQDGRFANDERVTGPGGGGLFVRDTRQRLRRLGLLRRLWSKRRPLRLCAYHGRHATPDGSMFSYVLRLHAFRANLLSVFLHVHQ